MTLRNSVKRAVRRMFFYLTIIGPGLITASADNDAPGIATYSMAGSTYGYAFLWMILVVTVGEVVVQEMAARMGAATGSGLADLIRERFGVKTTAFAMFCLLLANFGTTVASSPVSRPGWNCWVSRATWRCPPPRCWSGCSSPEALTRGWKSSCWHSASAL